MMLSDYDPLVIVNAKIRLVSDSTQLQINQINIWLNQIINQTEKEASIKKDRCEVCESKEDKKRLQNNHIAGIKHDYRQATVCIPCHRELTDRQKIWDARWWSSTDSDILHTAFLYMGLYDMLALKAQKTNNYIYGLIGNSLRDTASLLLRGLPVES